MCFHNYKYTPTSFLPAENNLSGKLLLTAYNHCANDRFRKLVVLNQGSGPDLQFQRKEHWAAIKRKEVFYYV